MIDKTKIWIEPVCCFRRQADKKYFIRTNTCLPDRSSLSLASHGRRVCGSVSRLLYCPTSQSLSVTQPTTSNSRHASFHIFPTSQPFNSSNSVTACQTADTADLRSAPSARTKTAPTVRSTRPAPSGRPAASQKTPRVPGRPARTAR